jgi:hypothetical protein
MTDKHTCCGKVWGGFGFHRCGRGAKYAHITHDGSDDIRETGVARWAYEMADAMLAERSKP